MGKEKGSEMHQIKSVEESLFIYFLIKKLIYYYFVTLVNITLNTI